MWAAHRTNISVGGARLGLKTALVTGLGEDPVGDFIVAFLQKEGVDFNFSPRKPGHRTSAVVLGIEPPDRFRWSTTGKTALTSS